MGAVMPESKQWAQMSVEEKLEMLRLDVEHCQRGGEVITKILKDMLRRLDEIDHRFEELPLS
jgi:hypothetical protein